MDEDPRWDDESEAVDIVQVFLESDILDEDVEDQVNHYYENESYEAALELIVRARRWARLGDPPD